MLRFPLRLQRFVVVGIPLVLLAVVVGCGRQNQPEAAQAPPDEKKDTTAVAVPSPVDESEDQLARLKPEIADSVEKVKRAQENLRARPQDAFVPAKPQSDSVILGGSGKGEPGLPFAPPYERAVKGAQPAEPKPQSGYNAQNAEVYGVYRENDFRSPLVAALSTFSADVNTASYANIRRILNNGQLPPANAVFLAEFINYFPYKYAPPKGDDPVAFHVEMGPCPWNRQHHLVRIGMQAYQIPADKMPPRNLVFLIDTSGSMQQENRLPLVQKSLALLVDQLGEKDRVSIVTYAGDSRVALMPTKGSDKKTIKSMIDSLSANGSTNGEGGIRKAYDLARATFIDGGVNRVILCTDGDFNVGVTDNGELVKLIEEQRRSKVFLTILGFGMGNYKDERLKELANHGNGHHAYIDTLDEAKKVFVEQGGALVCVAKDVKFQVDFNPAKVNAYRLIGYENRLLKDEDFKDDKKDAGDLGSGHQVTVLYEIVPSGVKIDLPGVDPSKYQKKEVPKDVSDEWLTVRMRYKHPEAETSKELSHPLKGAVAKELSDDFRFAASVASFGMILRDSKYRGAMTYAGVVEEAQGCLGADPNGHRNQFLELVQIARMLAAAPNDANGALTAAGIDEDTLRKIAVVWSSDVGAKRSKKLDEVLATIPPKYHSAVKDYFAKLEKTRSEKK